MGEKLKSIWSGLISFGLVNIPVELYSASKDAPVKLSFLHKKDLSPIRYARICLADGEEVPYEQIVRGYEFQKGDYVILDEKDFQKARPAGDQNIEVLLLVNNNEVDIKLYDKPYYLAPAKQGRKAYVLLREALSKTGKIAIIRFGLKTREHMGVLKPEGDVILLNRIRYNSQIRDYSELGLPKRETVPEKELKLAVELIEKLSGKFIPSSYKDNYNETLTHAVKNKISGKKVSHVDKEILYPTRVPDLMEKLKASLGSSGLARPGGQALHGG